jgi:hypothetical protein
MGLEANDKFGAEIGSSKRISGSRKSVKNSGKIEMEGNEGWGKKGREGKK